MVLASNICARVNIFEEKYKITSYDRNLTNFFPKLLSEILLKHEVLKIINTFFGKNITPFGMRA